MSPRNSPAGATKLSLSIGISKHLDSVTSSGVSSRHHSTITRSPTAVGCSKYFEDWRGKTHHARLACFYRARYSSEHLDARSPTLGGESDVRLRSARTRVGLGETVRRRPRRASRGASRRLAQRLRLRPHRQPHRPGRHRRYLHCANAGVFSAESKLHERCQKEPLHAMKRSTRATKTATDGRGQVNIDGLDTSVRSKQYRSLSIDGKAFRWKRKSSNYGAPSP